jgi:hypothetical protein
MSALDVVTNEPALEPRFLAKESLILKWPFDVMFISPATDKKSKLRGSQVVCIVVDEAPMRAEKEIPSLTSPSEIIDMGSLSLHISIASLFVALVCAKNEIAGDLVALEIQDPPPVINPFAPLRDVALMIS